jgi:hypothetical protein
MNALLATERPYAPTPPSKGVVGLPTPSGVRWYSQGAYTVEQAGCLFLGMSRAAAFKAAEEGRIPTVRISERRLMVTAEALDRMLYPEDYPSLDATAGKCLEGGSGRLAVAG